MRVEIRDPPYLYLVPAKLRQQKWNGGTEISVFKKIILAAMHFLVDIFCKKKCFDWGILLNQNHCEVIVIRVWFFQMKMARPKGLPFSTLIKLQHWFWPTLLYIFLTKTLHDGAMAQFSKHRRFCNQNSSSSTILNRCVLPATQSWPIGSPKHLLKNLT